MKLSTTLLLAITSVFVGQTWTFPLFGQSKDILPKRIPQAPAYSVVAVDGGSSSSSDAAATKTVTDAVTQVSTATILTTIIATQTDSKPTTIVAAQTVTVSTGPSVTSVPYDNGQWHTTYYFRSTVATQANVAVTSTESTAQQSTTSVPDPGQWSYWSGKDGTGR